MTVITISRQLGSQGTTLGRMLASRLGYPLVHRELINKAARLAKAPDMALATIDELGLFGIEPDPSQQQLYLEAVKTVIEDLAHKTGSEKARVLAEALNTANSQFLNNDKSPSRKVGELDTRGSHFYLAMYWAQALANQDEDSELKAIFTPVAEQLAENEEKIVTELNEVQGKPADIGGYYRPDRAQVNKVMRASPSLNKVIDGLN